MISYVTAAIQFDPWVITGLVIAGASVLVAEMNRRRSKKVDEDAKYELGIGHLVDGLNGFIDQLQEDGADCRSLVSSLRSQNESLTERNVGLIQLVSTLEHRIEDLDKRIAIATEFREKWIKRGRIEE